MWIDFRDNLPAVAFDLLIRTTILLAIAGIVVIFLRRASAAYRHLAWALALAGVLLQPLLSNVSVPWSVAVPLPMTTGIAPSPSQVASSQPQVIAQPSTILTEQSPAAVTANQVPYWTTAGLCIWIGGTVLVLSQLLLGMRQVHVIHRQSVAPTGELAVSVEGVLSGLSISREISVCIAPEGSPVCSPMTWGWYRPAILLPASAAEWYTEQVRITLLHEIGHIRRSDWLVHIGMFLTCAFYWWHPLVWWAAGRARAESEWACDDFVLNAGIAPTDYATHLVAMVRAICGGASHPRAAVAMVQPSGIESRIRATLSGNINRHPVTRRNMAISAGVVILLLGALVCLHPAIGTAAPSSGRNTISFYYLSTVECAADSNRPLKLERVGTSNSGKSLYRFTNKWTGNTFRDGAPIADELAQLVMKGKTPHAGAVAFAVPAEFRGITLQTKVYLTASQRKEAESLRTEIRAWRKFLATSPRILSSADLEPKTVATPKMGANQVGIKITLTPAGAKKLGDFTGKHRNEILGIVIDPDQPGSQLLMAPNINEAITSATHQISAFQTLEDAEKLAKHLNAY